MANSIKVNHKTVTQNGVNIGSIWGYQKGEYIVKNLHGKQTSRFTYFADAVSFAKNNPDFFNAE